jgi:septum site-determining protein MinC
MTPTVNIKGIRDGLLVSVSGGSWLDARDQILSQIQQRSGFMKGARVTLDVGGHELPAAEMGKLRDSLSELGITLFAVVSTSATTENNAQSLGLGTRLFKPTQRAAPAPRGAAPPGDEGLFVARTVRSGTKIEFPGHVTVMGDVNPGAEIVSRGSIVVWGRLKGVVHAGAEGDENAVICALALAPTQLRIAGTIAIPPDQRGDPKAEIARIRGGQVVVEPWSSR